MFLTIKEQFSVCSTEVAVALLQKRPTARTNAELDRLAFFFSKTMPLFNQFSKAMCTEVCVCEFACIHILNVI